MHVTKHIGRRKFLRGSGGALLALPALESTSTAKGLEKPPARMVASGIFYGLMPSRFHPKETGTDYTMPQLLKPMERHRNNFTVFSGLDHNIGGGHNSTKFFLNGIPLTQAKGYAEANISIDQKAAAHVGSATRYPSLVLGCETNTANYISWTRNGSPILPVTRIDDLYNLLFRQDSPSTLANTKKDMATRRSILDLVRGQAKTFEKGIGKADQEKLDQYLTSIRELEIKIGQAGNWLDQPKPKTDYTPPAGIDAATLREKTPIFYDLMALALQTDSTRVITLSFTELGKQSGGLPGISQGYHSLSHHGKVKSVMDELAIIETFYVTQFARFLDKLKAIQEPNGQTLLDNTLALFGSGMSNGNSHSNRDLPVLLAGGKLQHGQHRHYARNRRTSVPLCNLYVTMLQQFGLETNQFNTSNGNLSEIV